MEAQKLFGRYDWERHPEDAKEVSLDDLICLENRGIHLDEYIDRDKVSKGYVDFNGYHKALSKWLADKVERSGPSIS